MVSVELGSEQLLAPVQLLALVQPSVLGAQVVEQDEPHSGLSVAVGVRLKRVAQLHNVSGQIHTAGLTVWSSHDAADLTAAFVCLNPCSDLCSGPCLGLDSTGD